MESDNPNRVIIRPRQAEEITGLHRSTLWRKETAGDFPRSVQLGPLSKGWWKDEVLSWLESRRVKDAAA